MKEDVGTSKPKKHANKVGMLTYDPQSLPYNLTYMCVSTYTAINQNTKSSTFDIPTSFIFIEMFFDCSCFHYIFFLNGVK